MGLRANVPLGVVMLLCAASAAVAGSALLANARGHNYYRSTRETKKLLEATLGLGDFALTPTAGMGADLTRFGKVRHFQSFMLGVLILAALGFAGATAIERLWSPDRVRVAVSFSFAGDRPGTAGQPVVVSSGDDDHEIRARGTLDQRAMTIVELEPGDYQVSTLAGPVCTKPLTVREDPLQTVTIKCP